MVQRAPHFHNHTVEELTDRLADTKEQIRDWEDEFNVESPNQLRGTIANEALDEIEDRITTLWSD